MASVFFIGPVLKTICDGELFRRVFGTVLRVVAILVAIGGIVAWIRLWRLVFDLPGIFAIIGGIIFQLILVLTIYMVTHTIWIRASTVDSLPRADFTIIPIASILLKLAGELYACVLIPVSIASGIVIWLGGGNLLPYLQNYAYLPPSLPFLDFLPTGGLSFLGGALVMVSGIIAAFVSLVFFYMLSEFLVVTVDIARNLRVTREVAECFRKSQAV